MEWGRRLEPAVLQKFLDEHPEYLPVEAACTWAHDDRPWQIASPDALLATVHTITDHNLQRNERVPGVVDDLLEVKTTHYGDGWGDTGTDQIPIYYRTQTLWYLDVFGYRRCHLAVLIGGSDYREYVVEYDPVEAEELRIAAAAFLADLRDGVLPDLDAHTATYEAVRELHPDIDGSSVELDERTALDYVRARALAEDAKAHEQLTKTRVADAMGDAQRATFGDYTIATRQARNGGTPYLVAGRKLPSVAIPPRKETD